MKPLNKPIASGYRFRRLGQQDRGIPLYPHHYMCRGERLRRWLESEHSRSRYLSVIAELRHAMKVSIYSYCLMPNHVHMIVHSLQAKHWEPFVQALAALHGVAHRPSVSGPRQTSSKLLPIDNARYWLSCARYIDLNPVNARVVRRPEDYAWSSYRARVGLEANALLDPDPCLQTLGASETEQHSGYRLFVEAGVPEHQHRAIRAALNVEQCA